MPESIDMPTTEFLLERMKLGMTRRIGAFARESMKLARDHDPITDEFAYRFSAQVLAERVLETDTNVYFSGPVTVRLPRLKGAWRLLRGKPVEATVHGTVTVPATYWRRFPEAEIQYPESLGTPLRFVALGTPAWSQDV
jgi:hypothetical protein